MLDVGDIPHEARLKQDLLQNYELSVRPIYNTSAATTVTIDLALHQIIDVVRQTVNQTLLCLLPSQLATILPSFDYQRPAKTAGTEFQQNLGPIFTGKLFLG